MAKNETDQQQAEQQQQPDQQSTQQGTQQETQQGKQQDPSAPAAEQSGNNTVDTNAGENAIMGSVADQPDGTEDDSENK